MTDELFSRLTVALAEHYRIERRLGEGGMATVYLAEDLKHQREVAVKVLKPEVASAVGTERFLSEIETTAGLQHPHILPLFDSGEADGFLYYVMPYVEGETLRDRLDRDTMLPVEDAVRIAQATLSALRHAHERKILHRDVKPSNILLSEETAVVADFGIALALDQASSGRLTRTGASIGTPLYMSPEQASAEPVDERSDLWAVGCILHEMLTGEPPHRGANVNQILASVVSKNPEPITERRPTAPPWLAGVVRKALQPLPADRFQSAEEFLRALRDEVSTLATSAPSSGRTPIWVWAAGSVLLLLLASAVTFVVTSDDAEPPPLRRFSISLDVADVSRDHFGAFALSPNGEMLAFNGFERGSGSALYVLSLDDIRPRRLEGTEGARQPFWSPDGQNIGYLVPGGLYRAPLAGGNPVLLAEFESARPRGANWSPDGERIVFTPSTRSPLFEVPTEGGPHRQITELDPVQEETSHRWPRFLPDGSLMFLAQNAEYGAPDDQSAIELLTPEGERGELVRSNSSPVFHDGYLLHHHAGDLVARAYDESEGQLVGETRVVVEGVGFDDNELAFADAAPGILVYGVGNAGVHEIAWRDASGGLLGVVTERGVMRDLDVSPDGRRIGWVDDYQSVRVWDGQRGTETVLTRQPIDHWSPALNADGDAVVYARGPQFFLKRVADPQTEDTLFATRNGAGVRHMDWSNTGRHVAFADDFGALGVYDFETGEIELRLPPAYNREDVAVSPDGRLVAFTSTETGTPEIYAITLSGPVHRWRISNGGGSRPTWSRDGRTLVYRGPEDSFMTVSVDGVGAGTTFSIPTRLFQLPGSVEARMVTEDSLLVQRFRQEQSPQAIHVILGWELLFEQGAGG